MNKFLVSFLKQVSCKINLEKAIDMQCRFKFAYPASLLLFYT